MNLSNCFKKSYFDRIQLGVDYDTFNKTWSPDKPVKKWDLIPDLDIFACIVKGAEFMFEYGKLVRVKIADMSSFFDESRRNINNLTMDKSIQQWIEHGFAWEIYRLYTVGHRVILRCNDVIYEFEFEKNRFRLYVVRFYEMDRFEDNRRLIGRLQNENDNLQPKSTDGDS
jgi:hypothetical protein